MNNRQIKKVGFINPRGAERNNQNLIIQDIFPSLKDDLVLIGDDTEFVPHLGLLVMASLLPDYIEPIYVDEEYIPLDQVQSLVFREDFDLVCLSAYNPQAFRAYEIASWYRERGIPAAMGGLHATGVPQEASQYVDSVFIGEGEYTFPKFIQDLKAGSPQKIYLSEKPVDLKDSPSPRFNIVPNFSMYNKIPLIATRGCPHRCDFCIFPSAYHSVFRHKPIENIIQEVRMIKKLHHNPFLSFSDENMLADRSFAKKLAEALIDEKIPWECYCDISIAEDDHLLSLLNKSRCRLVQIGFETLDPDNLKHVDPWKYRQVIKYPKYIKKIQDAGIPVMAMFIAGFDGDDAGVFKKLGKFIMDNHIREIDFAVMTPMPGTPLFDKLKKEGRILTENWDRYTWTHVNFQPMKMTAEELQRGPLSLFRFFTRMAAEMEAKENRFASPQAFHVRSMK